MARKSAPDESGPSVPAYIVTFSDMVTLLLTFFVLLISLAHMQDPEKYQQGREAFVRHINTFGLGILFGQSMVPDFGNVKLKYNIKKPQDDIAVRTVDAKEENLQKIFSRVNDSMNTMPSNIVSEKTIFSVTNISFPEGDARLNESAKKFLTQYAVNLQQNLDSKLIKLYVLGLARDVESEKEQWLLSAKRAQNVADYLNKVLPSKFNTGVYSWGAGPGGCWVAKDDIVSEQSQILIAVLRGN